MAEHTVGRYLIQDCLGERDLACFALPGAPLQCQWFVAVGRKRPTAVITEFCYQLLPLDGCLGTPWVLREVGTICLEEAPPRPNTQAPAFMGKRMH